ncbi:uncharacterized protein EDB91DRAFT_1080985 [Suillus paluster]|uniref:uncharacterized protein n=1 Tax=Suillus paluster TaxID=48578 RepID=UPI001B85C0D7|nr:uncharacterized protein EDB91DRAFT_1080985 [Suillus paluster]KAG1743582.1 hypothetical protein EDB91DRAFT_1080985 [Suillus paluster]
MCNPQNDIEMRDYCELSDQDDDHLGNQDGGDVDEAELGEIEDSQHKAGSPSRTSAGLPHRAMRNDCGDPILIVERHPEAGRVLRCDDATHATYMWTCHDLQSKDNQYHPFLDEGDYKVARWAIKQGPNQNALTDFLSIDECYSDIRHQRRIWIILMQDPVESIKELWANPAYLEHLTYAPEHRFADEGKSEHIYDEFMSGDWAWEMQTLLPDGTTLVPVILSSDKTQLCQFRGDKTTYPVYLTIGNISKSIRRKPSFRTQKLIGHLPTVSLDGNDLSTDNARLIRTQLFHYAMGVSGPEHREICKQLLGCIVDAPGAPAGVIHATRSLLDFLEITQYQSHTEATLGYLTDALDQFHDNKDVFINLGARNIEDFNFAKLHSLEHYVNSIQRFGTIDNYNTEASERLHIDYAKDAYKATNKKEFWEQMMRWLERRETMAAFDLVLQWRRGEIPKHHAHWRRLLPPGVYLAKNPSAHVVSFRVLEDQFGAVHFKNALGEFIANQLQPTSYRLEGVDVWYCVKFAVPNLQVDTESTTLHTAHAEPKRFKCSGIGELDAWFDTVLVNESEHEETGIEGKRVARLKVIFHIPDKHLTKMGVTRQIGHLAYVEWFSRPRNKDPNSGMYLIS